MSSSNIIKLHSLQLRTVVIDPGARLFGAGDVGPYTMDGVDPLTADFDEANGWAGLDTEDLGGPVSVATQHSSARLEAARELVEVEAEEIRQQAYREGYQSGYAEGLVGAKAESLENVRRLSELARNAAVDMTCMLKTVEETVIGLALSIAEKVVYKRLGEDRSIVVSMVKGALEYADPVEVIRVRVNPEDVEMLRSHWEEGQVTGAGRNIELTADPSVQLGGCIIDTKSSILDAQIETKLAEVDMALRAELEASAR